MMSYGYMGYSGINAAPRDVTPDAVNWADISGAGNPGNANQTISGITSTITLRFNVTINTGTGTLTYNVNDGLAIPFTDEDTLIIANGSTLNFNAQRLTGTFNGSIDVINQSDADATLDSFTFNATA